VEHVAAEFIIPIRADGEGKRAGQLPGNLLAALGDAGKDGDGGKYRDEPQQALLVARLLQVKAGDAGTKKLHPRQKETDAQTKGAQIDQLRPAQANGLIFRRSGGGRGF